MKKTFYFGVLLLILFEILNVFFIMPMPGSQEINSIEIAYFLYSWRWVFRIILGLMIAIGFLKLWNTPRRLVRILTLIPLIAVVYLFNFVMVADKMFLQAETLVFKSAGENDLVPADQIIIGVECNGEAKAYPLEFLAYHHQVRDIIGGKEIMVTYCSVCRTGRVYEPLVDGKTEKFRLVGMDHFNAMFEDETTGSWWRQVNGEAITGSAKGKKMPEYFSVQMSLDKWLALYPNSLIMQPDSASIAHYDKDLKFERGEDKSSLTGTNPDSWQTKSWVVGIEIGDSSTAYDWNELKSKRIINDRINQTNLAIVLVDDDKSFVAFERPSEEILTLSGDTLFHCDKKFNLAGTNFDNRSDFLKRIPAYQEFWHSWLTFHPNTQKH
jgi:hypothetical protein